MKITVSPIARVSFGILMLTLSLIMASEWLGLIPNAGQLEIENRKKFSENLAIQLSSLATGGDERHIRTTLEALVNRNEDVVSAAFRSQPSGLDIETQAHERNLSGDMDERLTRNHITVPIFKGSERWGAVEVQFAEGKAAWLPGIFDNNFITFLAFLSISGFVLYSLFLKRTMRELDPSNVIPPRVRAAFDALAEGVLILDEDGNIVLANSAFANRSSLNPSKLVGTNAADLNWSPYQQDHHIVKEKLPWSRVIRSGKEVTGSKLTIHARADAERSYAVNCTPLSDDANRLKGVIATFDDLTELEKKNVALSKTLIELKKSKTAVDQKTKELEYLATRDPLTNCLNRRAFGEKYQELFNEAQSQDNNLICIMIDIDHFKRVNDNYGHSMGDKVIKFMAETVQANIRKCDLLARYGGEEFCVILDNSGVEQAVAVAERMRKAVKSGDPRRFTSTLHITASFGIASLADGVKNGDELVNNADKALYLAKESGRNKVLVWDESADNQAGVEPIEEPGTPEQPAQPEQDLSYQVTEASTAADYGLLQKRIKELERVTEEKAQQLDRYFSHDSLTKLPTRELFADRVEQALLRAQRTHCVAAVLSLGLDDLGRINATLGHEYAEKMLVETARRLNHVLRATDSVSQMFDAEDPAAVSKLNDGEFGILLSAAKNNKSITWIVKRIFDALHEPFYINDHAFNISSNIGIGVYPTDGTNAKVLIKKASVSRYYAEKLPGSNNVEYFSEDINQMSKEQLHIESQLSDAIENNEFVVYYQPKVDLRAGFICGFESLVRWQHPKRGILPPSEFIDIAEQTRLINVIGEWVLRESCKQLRIFERHCDFKPSIAVNLSPVQLSQPDLVERIGEILEETGVEPYRLELELTESCLMENLDTALDSLAQLQARGMKISVDDFGTGYSALSYLRSLPIDCLKVDRAFVADIDTNSHDHAIITAIISMAKALDLKIVAEGVETPNQLEALMAMNCDTAQGYLFSRPVPAKDAIKLLEQPLEEQHYAEVAYK
ncbi:MAG: EAL domain-containing protein [Halieaceae bacterium]